MKKFDFTPLVQKVSWSQAKPYFKKSGDDELAIAILIVGMAIICGLALLVRDVVVAWTVIGCGVSIGLFVMVVVIFRAYRKAKIEAFAAVNKLQFVSNKFNPRYNGMFFNVGHNRIVDEALVIPDGSSWYEIGSYTYITGSGRQQQTHHCGYIRFRLSRNLPHMVLDNKKNNWLSISNLPQVPDRDQTLRLEGNFNDHFTLYAPKQYEADALYIFTPDVMAVCVDTAEAMDIEIIDDELYVYMNGKHNLSSQSVIETMTRVADAVGARVEHQADYYMDASAVSREVNLVAQPGKRLSSRMNWWYLMIVVGAAIAMVMPALIRDGTRDISTMYTAIPVVLLVVVVIVIQYRKDH